MINKVRTKLPGIIGVSFLSAWIAIPARAAIVHYADTVAHPHIPSWEDNDGHHQHRSNNPVMNWGTGEGRYDGYAVWSNENFNYPTPKDITTHGSHGFIQEDPVSAPDFFFAGDWTLGEGAKAKSLVSQAFKTWSDITSDKPNLTTGILFNETALEAVAEIKVSWATEIEFPNLVNTVAYFDPNPQGTGSDAFYNLIFKRNHDWFFEGTKADFLASGKQDDFLTVALHETGHVLGLDHQNDIDDIMAILAGSKTDVAAGGAFRALSADDLNGARDLYSVPVPEPGITLLSSGLALGLGGLLKRESSKKHKKLKDKEII